jgi:hypothetical protein
MWKIVPFAGVGGDTYEREQVVFVVEDGKRLAARQRADNARVMVGESWRWGSKLKLGIVKSTGGGVCSVDFD